MKNVKQLFFSFCPFAHQKRKTQEKRTRKGPLFILSEPEVLVGQQPVQVMRKLMANTVVWTS